MSLRIQFECGKMRKRITLNTDNFYAVSLIVNILKNFKKLVKFEVSSGAEFREKINIEEIMCSVKDSVVTMSQFQSVLKLLSS